MGMVDRWLSGELKPHRIFLTAQACDDNPAGRRLAETIRLASQLIWEWEDTQIKNQLEDEQISYRGGGPW